MRLKSFFLFFVVLAASWAVEPVRYIVELTGDPAIVRMKPERDVRRAAIRGEQTVVERRLRSTARNMRVVARLNTAINAMIVEAEAGDLAKLAALPGVKRVKLSRDLKLHLDRSLDLHKVRVAWEASGTRGRGMKVGILDTGIQSNHPGFQPPTGMAVPDGFPQASSSANLALTSAKVIVARTFEENTTVADTYGHGTATAMIAAGVEHTAPNGVISGFAPDAYLGIYKVSRFLTNTIPTDFILQALDAAAADLMDVVNISLGAIALDPFPDDQVAEVTNRMAESGTIVVNSAGNDGPEVMSLDGSASAPLVIGVGSAQNSRSRLSPAVVLPDGTSLSAMASSGVTASTSNAQAAVVDVTQFDSTSLLCNRVADGVFSGKIPLILRGECNFTVKLRNAYLSGATTAIVYNRSDNATPNSLITMSVDDDSTIPGLFIGYDDGAALKQSVAAATEESPYRVQVRFVLAGDPNQLSSFSSLGPSIDYAIKPDLVATGGSVYTAGQTDYISGGMYTSSGYVTVSGTSFSSPMVAGAAAVLKAARPGLYADDYRSLLIHSARPLTSVDGSTMDVMKGGAGSLNLENALKMTLSARPVSVSFGLQDSKLDTYRQVIVKNLTDTSRSYTLEIQSANEVKPLLTVSTLTLAPGEIAGPSLMLLGEYAPGNYQGFLVIRDDQTQAEARVPYWLAVRTGKPTQVSVPIYPESFRSGSTVSYYFRLHDISGAIVEGVTPEVTATLGNSTIRRVSEVDGYPGLWHLEISVGTTSSAVEIVSGDVKRTITFSPE
jgi:subtilisin family serine protease